MIGFCKQLTAVVSLAVVVRGAHLNHNSRIHSTYVHRDGRSRQVQPEIEDRLDTRNNSVYFDNLFIYYVSIRILSLSTAPAIDTYRTAVGILTY